MPLTTCPDCHKEISDAAPTCPHCGRPAARPSGMVTSSPTPLESDVKRGHQRSKGREEVGHAIAFAAILIAIFGGIAAGSIAVGLVIAGVGIVAGLFVQYG